MTALMLTGGPNGAWDVVTAVGTGGWLGGAQPASSNVLAESDEAKVSIPIFIGCAPSSQQPLADAANAFALEQFRRHPFNDKGRMGEDRTGRKYFAEN
jgi:hypothetical protein